MKRKRKGIVCEGIKWVFTVCFLVIYLYPILLIMFSSLKTKAEMARNPSGPPESITFEYFAKAFENMRYDRAVMNTAVLAFSVTVLLLLMSSMAAYAIARKGKKYNGIYYLFLAGMLVPFQVTMIPLYRIMMDLKLINTLRGVACVYLATRAPFSIFLLTGFVKSVPVELEEAAYIDGAGVYRTFGTIVFPLLKSPLTTVAVLNIFTVWNDFLMPMLFLQSRDKLTLTVTLANFQGMYFNDWSMIFAGVCMIVLPVLLVYLSAQRFIISGITAGAVKG